MSKKRPPTKCPVLGCTKLIECGGYCWAHYQRKRRHGDPLLGRTSEGSLPTWIEAHRNYDGDDCLTWPFARVAGRYGRVTREGKPHYAHRIMCELRHGPPPTPKHDAAHSCGKGFQGCVNPRHLDWKTRKENMADKLKHGTHIYGEKCGSAKISDSQAWEIFQSTELTNTLAKRFGLSKHHIRNIQRGIRRSYLFLESRGQIP